MLNGSRGDADNALSLRMQSRRFSVSSGGWCSKARRFHPDSRTLLGAVSADISDTALLQAGSSSTGVTNCWTPIVSNAEDDAKQRGHLFHTTVKGKGNQGHEHGTSLPDIKRALIAYLKML
jgi:hypothetical protein